MDLKTGEVHYFKNEKERKIFESTIGRKLVPLTEKQAKKLEPLSNRRRKALLAGMKCPCASGKSFKKCCWKKYKRQVR